MHLTRTLTLILGTVAAAATGLAGAGGPALIWTAAAGPVEMARFEMPGRTPAVVNAAVRTKASAQFPLPSYGSGLTWLGGDAFLGITDRGPNEGRPASAGLAEGTLFPHPTFTPTVVRFHVRGGALVVDRFIPLHDAAGRGVTGLPNTADNEPAFADVKSPTALPWNPDGLDIEGVRRFPDGRLLLVDEYAPSIVVASADGQVLMRYSPASKPLRGATYPVRNNLPDVFTHRRDNRGFENIALSPDGRTAYVTLESPLGPLSDPIYAKAAVLRTLKLDVSDPLNATVVGEYLVPLAPVSDYPESKVPNDVKVSDAAWLAPDVTLMIERAKHLVRLVVVDYRAATNILARPDAAGLGIEAGAAGRDIVPASRSIAFTSRDLPAIDQDKIEGLAVLDASTVVLASDNDFGIGDNTTGAPSRLWKIHLAARLPTSRALPHPSDRAASAPAR